MKEIRWEGPSGPVSSEQNELKRTCAARWMVASLTSHSIFVVENEKVIIVVENEKVFVVNWEFVLGVVG